MLTSQLLYYSLFYIIRRACFNPLFIKMNIIDNSSWMFINLFIYLLSLRKKEEEKKLIYFPPRPNLVLILNRLLDETWKKEKLAQIDYNIIQLISYDPLLWASIINKFTHTSHKLSILFYICKYLFLYFIHRLYNELNFNKI